MSERYGFSLTTFSPSGKLVQIEYALHAVQGGATSVGIKASNGVVIATEKKLPTVLIDEDTLNKVSKITESAGLVYSGMGPDSRVLVKKARKIAQQYYLTYGETMPTAQLVREIASVMQEYTQSGGVRPFGVSLLLAGWDTESMPVHDLGIQTVNKGGPALYQIDPSGSYWAWKASAIGKNMINARTFLEKRFNEGIELEDAIHTAILTLKEGFEGQMTEHNIEMAIVNEKGFKPLSVSEIKDYLSSVSG